MLLKISFVLATMMGPSATVKEDTTTFLESSLVAEILTQNTGHSAEF
jgi:hypothetical protein